MGRKVKIGAIIASVIILLMLFQFKILDNHSWKSWNLPLSGKIIYLDAGHGGPDGGAGDQDALEKDIALNITLKIRDYLQQQGALVILTREEDVDLAKEETKGYSRRKTEDLKKRLALINSSEADLFVSIHLNSIPDPQWSGAQTFFAPQLEENQRAAKFIQDEFVKNLKNTTREAKAINRVYILKYAKKPGALVEVGFLSNPSERAYLKKDGYQEKIAVSVYNGIMRYFSNETDLK